MPLERTACPLDCPDACGVLVETGDDGSFVRLKGNPAHSWSRGSLCGKTAIYGEGIVANPERLTQPLVRSAAGELVPATWDDALDRVAERVRGLRGDELLALDYAGNMGQIARRFPMRVMHALGAVKHDGGICDNTSTVGYETVIGRVLGADLEGVEDSDALILWGADIVRTVQHLLPRVQRMAKRGCPVVVIDIYRTETMQRVEKWGGRGIVVRQGTDAALALGLARRLFEDDAADRAFLEAECVGVAEFERHARSRHDRDETCAITGVAPDEFEGLVRLLEDSQRPFLKTGVGWTRRRNGALGMRAVCSLAAVRGIVDRLHYESSDWFGLDTDRIERPELRPDSGKGEARVVRQVELGKHLAAGEFKAAFCWGHNPAVTLPDTRRVREGLSRDDLFLVVHELFLTETAELADVVLPAAAFVEQSDLYRSYGHRVLQYGRAACRPPGEARTNFDAFRALARRLGLGPEVWDTSPEELVREVLEASDRVTPVERERVLAGEPVKLAAVAREGRGTPSGKIELANAELDPPFACYVPDSEAGSGTADRERFHLIAAPSRATHNSTFSHSPRHLARRGDVLCHVHPADARELGLGPGARVRLENRFGALTLAVGLDDGLPPGAVRVDGLPRAVDVPEGHGINALVGPAMSAQAFANTLYSTRVDVIPLED